MTPTPASEGAAAAKGDTIFTIEQATTENLERWLRNNVIDLCQHKPHSAELGLCQAHTRRLATELIKRKGR